MFWANLPLHPRFKMTNLSSTPKSNSPITDISLLQALSHLFPYSTIFRGSLSRPTIQLDGPPPSAKTIKIINLLSTILQWWTITLVLVVLNSSDSTNISRNPHHCPLQLTVVLQKARHYDAHWYNITYNTRRRLSTTSCDIHPHDKNDKSMIKPPYHAT